MIYIVYCIVTVIVIFFLYFQWQRTLVFHPKIFRDMSLYNQNYTFLTLKNGNVQLEGCIYTPLNPKRTLLYFGGRGQDSVGLLPKLAEEFKEYNIVTFNYRGYGKSQGKSSQDTMIKDSDLIVEKVQKKYGQVDVIGYSLGGSIASYVASKHNVRSLTLVGAFCSLDSLIHVRYRVRLPFLLYRFPTCEYLSNVEVKVAIFLSKDDQVVPYEEGKKLKQTVKNLAIYKELENLNHVEVFWNKEVIEDIKRFIESLE